MTYYEIKIWIMVLNIERFSVMWYSFANHQFFFLNHPETLYKTEFQRPFLKYFVFQNGNFVQRFLFNSFFILSGSRQIFSIIIHFSPKCWYSQRVAFPSSHAEIVCDLLQCQSQSENFGFQVILKNVQRMFDMSYFTLRNLKPEVFHLLRK